MAKGEDTSRHPSRRVSRADMLFNQLQGMIEGTVAPRNSLAKMWSELPEDDDDMIRKPDGGAEQPPNLDVLLGQDKLREKAND